MVARDPIFVETLEPRRLLAAGSLDPTFGQGGIVRLSDEGQLIDLAIAPDGKIITLATDVRRFNADGSVDAAFGKNGHVFPSSAVGWNAMALESDGSIVLGGSFESSAFDLTLMEMNRLTPKGRYDATFSPSLYDSNHTSEITDVATFADGRIVLGGEYFGRGVVKILLLDGSNDPDFPPGDPLQGSSLENDSVLALQRDGTIITPSSLDLLDENGNPQPGAGAGADALAIDGSDRIYAAFGADSQGRDQISVARYGRDGRIDRTFGDNGVLITGLHLNGGDRVSIAVSTGGYVYVSGVAGDLQQPQRSLALIRLTPAGKLDPLWGDNGTVITTPSSSLAVGPGVVAIQQDGYVVQAAQVDGQTVIARFEGKRFAADLPGVVVVNKILQIQGTFRDDLISISRDASNVIATLNGVSESFPAGDVAGISIDAADGNDLVDTSHARNPVTILGDAGDDTLIGGRATDRIIGGDGNDRIAGGDHSDSLSGSGGNDRIDGNDGADFISGGGGRDKIAGGAGDDTLVGASGSDTVVGGPGNDWTFARDGFVDHIFRDDADFFAPEIDANDLLQVLNSPLPS